MSQTDKEKYEKSLDRLVANLNESYGSDSASIDIVIALSRKGPRLLELLVKERGLKTPMTVVTEHALPFLFDRINKDAEHHYRLFIVDDAIYFGSSILGLKEEIESYLNLYQLQERVRIFGVFSCIKDKESIAFPGVDVFSDSDTHAGFGHYFVKNIMKGLQRLGKSLEVEFPTIEYKFANPVDFHSLETQLIGIFGKERVYRIEENEGIKSITVILSEVSDTTFRKFRIFVKGSTVSVVSIAPELVPTNFELFRYVTIGSNHRVHQVWQELVAFLYSVFEYLKNHSFSTRNLVRTGVVLLNYFSSLDTYCYYKRDLESALLDSAGYIVKKSIDDESLYYLLGSNSYVEDIVGAWTEAICEVGYCTSPNANLEFQNDVSVVFELGILADMEAGRLERANLMQLLNCKSMEEALSSMFFNQTLMVERWSRGLNLNRQERLRFGYTFLYIWKNIWNNANGLKTEQLSQSTLHHWVDVQIDNGSIVPQYIIDKSNLQWTRVFRPGENEDFTISHLGRFVVHVLKQLSLSRKDDNACAVLRSNLEGVLAILFDKLHEAINDEEPNNGFSINDSHQLYYHSESVVDFLKRMFILIEDAKGVISLHSRVRDNEYSRNTTLSKELVAQIDSLINMVLVKAGDDAVLQERFAYTNTINYFMVDTIRQVDIQAALQKAGKSLLDIIEQLCAKTAQEEVKEVVLIAQQEYQNSLGLYELNGDVLQDKKSGINDAILPYLWKVRQMGHVVNLLIISYFGKVELLADYVKTLKKGGVLQKIDATGILDYLQGAIPHTTRMWSDRIFLSKLEDYMSNIILKF